VRLADGPPHPEKTSRIGGNRNKRERKAERLAPIKREYGKEPGCPVRRGGNEGSWWAREGGREPLATRKEPVKKSERNLPCKEEPVKERGRGKVNQPCGADDGKACSKGRNCGVILALPSSVKIKKTGSWLMDIGNYGSTKRVNEGRGTNLITTNAKVINEEKRGKRERKKSQHTYEGLGKRYLTNVVRDSRLFGLRGGNIKLVVY